MDQARPVTSVHRLLMKLSAFLMLTLALLSAGCGKKDATSPQAAAPAVEQPANPNAAADPSMSVTPAVPSSAEPRAPQAAPRQNQQDAQAQAVQTAALEGAVHAFMTIQLHKFIQENGRMPKDFSEFASARMDSVPFAPAGMEYVIDYANKQVKVVKIKKR